MYIHSTDNNATVQISCSQKIQKAHLDHHHYLFMVTLRPHVRIAFFSEHYCLL